MKKAIALLSSGIDSPVAAQIMKEKGLEIIGLHMDSRPFTDSRQISKTKRLCSKLGIKKLYIARHGLAMSEIIRNINRRFTCIVCRRLMFRTAERLAEKEKADFIITGENLGQVASQTLDNLAINDRATGMIILRPLLCYDKQEIVNMAKEIGTYEISIEPPGCCRLVPKNPATKSTIEQIEKEEARAGVSNLVDNIVIEKAVIGGAQD
ncbi:hypothetical protein GF345_05215 [Candidatus Woesearchaeota archaeon]|nr:hypothetical protein [Candidatus Woesearchaeota archaeon]